MTAAVQGLELRLLNEFQREFPLVEAPFDVLAEALEVSSAQVLETLCRLRAQGAVSRVGAVLAARRVGASTLAAVAAPPQELERLAALISARPEVNHNYEREHRFNLWFVATAADTVHLARTLAGIERDIGLPVMSLPLEQAFHIDLAFDLTGGGARGRTAGPACEPGAPRPLSAEEVRLMRALEPGLALVPRPFAALAEAAGLEEDTVLGLLRAWTGEGLVKRFGVVVRHHELGFAANAMVVFDVPESAVVEAGHRLAAEPAVTLCYRRPRHLPHWPYNLFAMVHGRERAPVRQTIQTLRERLGLQGCPHAVLFSRRRFKQQGARYGQAHG